jgi:hypothetical protein
VTFGNDDVAIETEIEKASSTNKKNGSSISTPTFSSGNEIILVINNKMIILG